MTQSGTRISMQATPHTHKYEQKFSNFYVRNGYTYIRNDSFG